VQLPLIKGLENIPERFRELGPLEGEGIGIGRQVDDGDLLLLANDLGGVDAAQFPLQDDVHEHQIGFVLLNQGQGLLPRGDGGDHVISQFLQASPEILGDDGLIFHNQDLFLIHDVLSSAL
jgi:hypothetical protein